MWCKYYEPCNSEYNKKFGDSQLNQKMFLTDIMNRGLS